MSVPPHVWPYPWKENLSPLEYYVSETKMEFSLLTNAWRKMAIQVQTSRIANVDPVGSFPSFGARFALPSFLGSGGSSKSHWMSLSWYLMIDTTEYWDCANSFKLVMEPFSDPT